MNKYKLTPKGVILLGAFNGLVKMSNETNVSPLELEFTEDSLYSMSEPTLSYQGANTALRTMVYGGLAKRV